MLKKEARKLYKEKRDALTDPEQSKLDDLMLIQFQSIDLPFLHSILTYWPIEENREPNTHLVTEFLRFRNPELKIAYPVSDFSTLTMTPIAVDIDTAFIKKELNIFEPQSGQSIPIHELDLVVAFVTVPADIHLGARLPLQKVVVACHRKLRTVNAALGGRHLRDAVWPCGRAQDKRRQKKPSAHAQTQRR